MADTTEERLKELLNEYGGLVADGEYGRAIQRRNAILAAFEELRKRLKATEEVASTWLDASTKYRQERDAALELAERTSKMLEECNRELGLRQRALSAGEET